MHEPLTFRQPNSGRSARQLYGSLQKGIENGAMGTREFAQEVLEFAVSLAKKGALEKGPAFDVFATRDTESLGFTPTWPPGKVTVQEVKHLSWAERKGITAGCQIVAVNDKVVETMEKRKFVEFLKSTRPLRISLYAPREEFTAALHQYAGFLLDALNAYKNSPTLDIWIVEALTNLHRFVESHRDQMAVPLFDTFSEVALRNASDNEEPQFHQRLLVGLGSMMNPECRFTTALINYILNQMQSRSGRLAPVTIEHGLALLGCARSAHRLHHQITITLEASRGFSSEVTLATRTLLTLSELYDLVAHRAAQPRDDWYSQTFGQEDSTELDVESVYSDGVPTDGSDVRLAITILDLHKENRKVAGAAARALAIMCKLTRDHLAAVLVDEPRGMLNAQQFHKSSRAVNHHAAEMVLLAARKPGGSLLTESTLLLASRAVRACPQDGTVVAAGLNALMLTAKKGEHENAIMESIPLTELIRIGEAHAANAELMVPLCELLLWQLRLRPGLRDEFVRTGAAAVPFRVIECAVKAARLEDATDDVAIALAVLAGTLVLRLTFGNEDAVHHAATINGGSALLGLLAVHEGNATATHAALMALKSITRSQAARRLVIRYEDPATWCVLDDILRYAEASADKDPDILAQACCALSTLTRVEGHEPSEDDMRVEINQDVLRKIIEDTRYHFPAFYGDEKYCLRLIAVAATEQHDQRLLDEQGNEIFVIAEGDQTRVAEWAEPMEEDEEGDFYQELDGPSTGPQAERIRGLRGRVKMADMEVQTDPIDTSSLADGSTTASTAERLPRRPSDLSSDRPSTQLGEGWMADLFGDEHTDEEAADEAARAAAEEDAALEKEMNRLMGFGWGDDQEEPDAEQDNLDNLPGRRRRHHLQHGFKTKNMPKIGKGTEDAGGGILGGMFGGATKEEDDEEGATGDKADKKDNADGAATDGGYLGGFGLGGMFGGEDSTQEGGAKAGTAAKKGGGEGDDGEGEEDEEGEGDEDQPDEGWGFGFGDDEDEEEAEERRKFEEEKKKKAEEEAAKKKGRFGGLFG